MKKQQCVCFGIAVLLTAALFTMTACGGGAGPGGIATSLRFRDAPPPASLNRSTRGISRAMMEGTTKDTASFSAIDAYYAGLGTRVAQITPTEFCLELNGVYTVTDGQDAALIDGNINTFQKIDFKNGAQFTTTYPSEAGTSTTEVHIGFSPVHSGIGGTPYGAQANARAKATFPITSAVSAAIEAAANAEGGSTLQDGVTYEGKDFYYYMNGIYDLSSTSITVAPSFLLKDLKEALDIHADPLSFHYAGNQYKYSPGTIPGAPGNPPIKTLGFVIPMNTINIPDNASSITLTVSMDLTNIIEQYPGNKFVLAKDFWERLAIGATF